MATKISELAGATTPLSGTEVLPLVEGGATKKATVQDLKHREFGSFCLDGNLTSASQYAILPMKAMGESNMSISSNLITLRQDVNYLMTMTVGVVIFSNTSGHIYLTVGPNTGDGTSIQTGFATFIFPNSRAFDSRSGQYATTTFYKPVSDVSVGFKPISVAYFTSLADTRIQLTVLEIA